VPLAICAIYFPNAPLKVLFTCLAAFSVVGACYQVSRETVAERDAEFEKRNAEIEALKHRPYDEEHRRLAERKVNALTESGKDLVYFLLHHGEFEAEDLRRRCQNPAYFDEAIQRARDERLVIATLKEMMGRTGVHYFWKINPEFTAVLQDLLGKRESRYFL